MTECIVKKTISFDDYKNCLLYAKSKSIYRLQLMFKNNKQQIHTVEVNLSFTKPFDTHTLYQSGSAAASMNVKFCRILEISLNILEMLKLFT